MNKHETIVPLKPPPPTRPAVIAHRRTLELERDALRSGAIELALSSAMGDMDARNKLASLAAKLAALQFEIDLNHQTQELCHVEDAAAEIGWRKLIQTLPPEEIVAGIGREKCPDRCTPGIPGGCCITAAVSYAGSTCSHPIRERHLFHLDDRGRRLFPYRNNAQASRIFDAACRRLKVGKEFSI
jgi:hypothetical protein